MYIECRTVSDSLFRKGRILSKTEKVYGHYRRFIVLDELLERLESQGFKVLPALENYHMVVNGNDNSAIIRICVKKG